MQQCIGRCRDGSEQERDGLLARPSGKRQHSRDEIQIISAGFPAYVENVLDKRSKHTIELSSLHKRQSEFRPTRDGALHQGLIRHQGK